jgi:hypothetical protein
VVFTVVIGVHEGSCLSPTLFIFFVRDLPTAVRQSAGTDGPVVRGVQRAIIFYADDVTELARGLAGLQVSTDVKVTFFRERELRINPEKSDLVIFVRPLAVVQPFSVSIDGVQQESVEVVRYLGNYVRFERHLEKSKVSLVVTLQDRAWSAESDHGDRRERARQDVDQSL